MSKNHNRIDYDTAVLDANPYDIDATYDNQTGARSSGGKVQPVPVAAFGDIGRSKSLVTAPTAKAQTLASMMDVPITLVFEVGRTKITIAHLMELREGSYISLRNVPVDVIDVRVNDKIIAEAEAIALQTRYGIRISEIEKMPGVEGDENV